MGLVEILLLAVSLSMDAFAVSICKGLSVRRIKPKHALSVGLWFGGFQGLMPVIGFVTSVLAKIFGGPDALEISVDLTGIVMGILVMCLSQFFAHGVKLENDVDGLV